MYSKQTGIGYTEGECVMPRGGPYRILISSASAAMTVQTSGAAGFPSWGVPVPPAHIPLRRGCAAAYPSQEEDAKEIMRRYRRTFELLAQ